MQVRLYVDLFIKWNEGLGTCSWHSLTFHDLELITCGKEPRMQHELGPNQNMGKFV